MSCIAACRSTNSLVDRGFQQAFVRALLAWFRTAARDLPWRRTYDPYHVWISEIMLQQTQMERGVAYFQRWIGRFPDVQSVAAADLQEIYTFWEGLGYYARARNLHGAAKIIAGKYGGIVPCRPDQLRMLPGIGPYTAAAIASVAGNHDIAVVDANVARVFSRLFDIDQPVKRKDVHDRIAVQAAELLPKGRARQFNQGLMDLGGLICTPKNPDCAQCPVQGYCLGFKKGVVPLRPLPAPPKETVLLHRAAAIVTDGEGRLLIRQRRADTVWGGLWEFPECEVESGCGSEAVLSSYLLSMIEKSIEVVEWLTTVRHQYTHHKITLDGYLCRMAGTITLDASNQFSAYRWVVVEELAGYGFPAGPRKIIEYMRNQGWEPIFALLAMD